ncbi:tyrosine-type recombinase/integrase [Nocardia halotolerans]|uniref:Tyrosine-type recombinase/integrase n=1 Tax=Nocardia halotolerans TaxID=1755878 RepID=A0ABV8VBR5_9NOCA
MSHIKDQWWGEEPDPNNPKKKIRFKKPGFGKGMRYKVVWTPPGQKETSKSFPDGKKREAQEFQTFIDNSILDRKYIDPKAGRRPFDDVAAEWVKTTSPDPASRDTKNAHLDNNIRPFFAGKTIEAAAAPSMLRDWTQWLNERRYGGKRDGAHKGRPLSPIYKLQSFQALNGIFALAVSERLILDNPCKAKEAQVPRVPKRLYIPWSRDRVDAVWGGLADRCKIVVPIGVGSGQRAGEMLGLSPADIDRRDMVINVGRQTKRVVGGVVFSLPKANKTRQVPLSKSELRAIDEHMEQFPPVAVTLPWQVLDGERVTVELLITDEEGEPWYVTRFLQGPWDKAFAEAGLDRRRQLDGLHALRHLYASQQLAGGVSVRELADYLGHEDAAVTLRTYTHLMPTSAPRSRSATDAWFERIQPATAQGRPDEVLEDDGSLLPEE